MTLSEVLDPIIQEKEYEYLCEVLKKNRGNISNTALHRQESVAGPCLRKMKTYQLNKADFKT